MSKATIYLYYKNKDDLFLHVVEKLAETTIPETAPDQLRRLGHRLTN